ncbi:MAG: radical SAM family heme chaperone HemW [Muribaculaceae bacterium]|nr:radical SAM family heme chaperone HemW [Muribaculaceae bacterium]
MLYLHIPFCHSKCIYCDFFSTPVASALYESYIDAIGEELTLRIGEIASPSSIYIGGGTPSILPLELTEKLLRIVSNHVDINRVREWTIEMNPEDVTPDRLDLYRSFGVNRISMGVQSFHDKTLKRIGRRHTADQAIRAIELLQKSGLNFSLDLIYGLPDEGMEEWSDSLARMLSYEPAHFSAYLLSYEPGTALYKMTEQGKITETSEQLAVAMYEHLCHEAAARGYQHYEISNFSKPGHKSYHNSRYWDGTPYLGIGCSAHSFTGGIRKFNPADIKLYINRLSNHETVFEAEPETITEQLNDMIITALRTSDGLKISSLDRFPPHLVNEFMQNMRRQLAAGNLIGTSDRIVIPERLWLRADAVMRELIL